MSKRPSHMALHPDRLTRPTDADALDPDDVRAVEPDAVECDPEWLASRCVDPRLGADLPRDVAQAIEHLGLEALPNWSPDLNEVEVVHEELARVDRIDRQRRRGDGGKRPVKVTDAEVVALRRDRASGLKVRELAHKYRISSSHAWRLARGICRPDVAVEGTTRGGGG